MEDHLYPEFKVCVNCRASLLEHEVFNGDLCGHCALKANEWVCMDCRGYGDFWAKAHDAAGRQIERRDPCKACDGTGTKKGA